MIKIKKPFSIFLSLEKTKRKWREEHLQPFHFPRCCFGIVSFDNFIFIIGGFDGNRAIASVECYDIVLNQWTIYPNIHKRRSSCISLFCDEKIYVVGGVAKNTVIKEIEEFDLHTGCWKVITKIFYHVLVPVERSIIRKCIFLEAWAKTELLPIVYLIMI